MSGFQSFPQERILECKAKSSAFLWMYFVSKLDYTLRIFKIFFIHFYCF